jgi:hypothetical protein
VFLEPIIISVFHHEINVCPTDELRHLSEKRTVILNGRDPIKETPQHVPQTGIIKMLFSCGHLYSLLVGLVAVLINV